MNFDPFTRQSIYHGGIWSESRCLQLEQSAIRDIAANLQSLGFTNIDQHNRHWHRGPHKVVLCLVDDIRSCSQNYATDMPYIFDKNTTVITDNFMLCPTQYQVINVPESFFGIYYHDVSDSWMPDREFCFSVNRLDDRRFKIMLEIAKRTHLNQGYVNFNCQQEFLNDSDSINLDLLRDNFVQHWHHLTDQERQNYQGSFDLLRNKMPFKNYDISHDDIHLRSGCNIVIETYGSDTSVAFSEKIFRALSLPVPWTLYAGHYAVAYLESRGFDCMRDLIDHNHYDRLKEIEDKIRVFVWKTLQGVRDITTSDRETTADRCQQAASHNRQILRNLRHRWQLEFPQWCRNLANKLAN